MSSIKEKIKKLPKKPGIYMMKDLNGNIIYVGKSKSLRDRVKSYFTNTDSHSRKIKRMVKNIADISIIITDTELDALMLECEKIQEIKPMYNTLMKKYENYKYIKIDLHENLGIHIVDDIRDDCIYLGPYTMDKKLEEYKKIVEECYKLPNCKKHTKCLRYDLNKCIGPCRNIENEKKYKEILKSISSNFEEFNLDLLKNLNYKMKEETILLNFEKANEIKKYIDLISSILKKQKIINKLNENKDILAWINLNENVYKLYLIINGSIVYSEIIDITKINNNFKDELILNISIKKIKYKENSMKKIDKSNIDYINIIYNYIEKSEDISYIYI